MTMPHIPIQEKHPFKPFIPTGAETLILGSFPCIVDGKYGDWFYSSSGRNDLWKLLSEIYAMPTQSREEKEALCRVNRLAITDIGLVIGRKVDQSCADGDLLILEYNHEGVSKAIKAGIRRILCTSKYVAEELKLHFDTHNLEVIALPSPSPNGSRAIGRIKEYKEAKARGELKNTYEFKLRKYRSALMEK